MTTLTVEDMVLFEEGRMSNKDRPRAEDKKHNLHHDEQVDARREERREKKHTLRIIRRRSRRTGHIPIPKG